MEAPQWMKKVYVSQYIQRVNQIQDIMDTMDDIQIGGAQIEKMSNNDIWDKQ